jgi:hypothetical protein
VILSWLLIRITKAIIMTMINEKSKGRFNVIQLPTLQRLAAFFSATVIISFGILHPHGFLKGILVGLMVALFIAVFGIGVLLMTVHFERTAR